MRFERSLRKKVRTAVRGSPSLGRAARRQPSRLRRPTPPWVTRVLLGIFVGVIVFGFSLDAESRSLTMNALAFWITGTMFWRAIRLAETLYQSTDLLVYHNLPLSDEAVFGRQWRRYLTSNAWLVFYFSVAYGVIVLNSNGSAGAWLGALALGALQAVLSLALSCLALRLLPPFFLLIGSVAMGGLALLASYGALGAGSWSDLARFLPAGWVHRILMEAVLGLDPLSWLLVLPTGMVVWSLVWSRARLADGYGLTEPVFRSDEPSPQPEGGSFESPERVGWRRGVTAVEESIHQRTFLEVESWAGDGLIERVVAGWLTQRERVVADFMIGPVLGATSALKKAGWAALASAAILFVVGDQGWVVFLCLAIVGSHALPLLQPKCRGLAPRFLGSGYAPPFAGFPFSYGELWRTQFKINLIRLAAALPLAIALGTMIGWRFDLGGWAGLLWGGKIWLLVLVLQPALFVIQTSANVHERITLGRVLFVLFVSLAGVALIAGVLMAERAVTAGACVVLLGCLSWLFLVWHRWSFDRGHFDLVRLSFEQ